MTGNPWWWYLGPSAGGRAVNESPEVLYDRLSILHLKLAYLFEFRDEVVRITRECELPQLRSRLVHAVADVNARLRTIPGAENDMTMEVDQNRESESWRT